MICNPFGDEPSERTILFCQGAFTMAEFAAILMPMVDHEAVCFPGNGTVNMWTWTGHDTCICQTYFLGLELFWLFFCEK
jgi:hypothetical protein